MRKVFKEHRARKGLKVPPVKKVRRATPAFKAPRVRKAYKGQLARKAIRVIPGHKAPKGQRATAESLVLLERKLRPQLPGFAW